MPRSYKSVPAIEKCFSTLDLLSKSNKGLGISEIAKQLKLNKSTVFNMVHTLIDLKVLHSLDNGKCGFGPRFYMLGNASGKRFELIQIVNPYMKRINQKTKLSTFLGIRSGLKAVLIDKVESSHPIRISSEVGMQMPVLAGVGIKAMLSQLHQKVVDRIIGITPLKKYTPESIVDKRAYMDEIERVRVEGIAFDREEYIEGISAIGVPLKTRNPQIQAALWVVGLKGQLLQETVLNHAENLLKDIAAEINQQVG
jgi:DNA-binding IclR family transcriptional regulator